MQYDLRDRQGRRLCAWHSHCAMFRLDPSNREKFMAFIARRQQPSAMHKLLEQKGLPTLESQWDADPSELWGMVNGCASGVLSAA